MSRNTNELLFQVFKSGFLYVFFLIFSMEGEDDSTDVSEIQVSYADLKTAVDKEMEKCMYNDGK